MLFLWPTLTNAGQMYQQSDDKPKLYDRRRQNCCARIPKCCLNIVFAALNRLAACWG